MASDPSRGRLEIAAVDTGEDETCQTFVMHGEDHTLGNTLRYMIMKNPEVKFCGYSIPHPSEHKINFRIQTRDAVAVDVLRQGFSELTALCEHVLNTFETSVDKFKSSQDQRMDTGS